MTALAPPPDAASGPFPHPGAAVLLLGAAVEHLDDALDHALACTGSERTPCTAWDLGELLRHLDDSLQTLGTAARGRVATDAGELLEALALPQLVAQVRRCAHEARDVWRSRPTSAPVAVDDLVLGRDTVVLVGAVEVAVHAWDVHRACRSGVALPEELAAPLLEVARTVVTSRERGRRFGPAYAVPPRAPAATQLLAHLGRHP